MLIENNFPVVPEKSRESRKTNLICIIGEKIWKNIFLVLNLQSASVASTGFSNGFHEISFVNQAD
jgi:hypothetical protein